MNNRTKMYTTNSKVRKYLIENNFKDLHFFPHSRFSKDVTIGELGFDGIASKRDYLVLFQCKSNCKPTKEMQNKYSKFAKKYNCITIWFNAVDRKDLNVFIYVNNKEKI